MFNLGMSEIILLGAIALLVIGPKQLPELARNLARFINEVKRSTGEFGKGFGGLDKDVKKVVNEVKNVVRDTENWVSEKKPIKTGHVDNPNHDLSQDEAKNQIKKQVIVDHEGFGSVPAESTKTNGTKKDS